MIAVGVTGQVQGTAPALPASPLVPKPKQVASSTSFGIRGGDTPVLYDTGPLQLPKGIEWDKPQTLAEAKPSSLIKSAGEKMVATFVADGDTAKLNRADGSNLVCRIDKIDAPETAKPRHGKPGQPYGDEAKRTLQTLIENKEVSVRIIKPKDQYSRSICQIEVEGSRVDLEMVKAGAAWLYRRYANDPALIEAEQTARKDRKGLWASPAPENPEVFRRRTRQAVE